MIRAVTHAVVRVLTTALVVFHLELSTLRVTSVYPAVGRVPQPTAVTATGILVRRQYLYPLLTINMHNILLLSSYLVLYLILGVCISYHYLEVEEGKDVVPGATMSPPMLPSSPTPSFSSGVAITTPARDLRPATSNAPSLARWNSIGSILGCLGLFTVLLFLLLFGLLQARSGEKLCWKHRYQPVPMYYHNGTKKVSPTKQDLLNEEEVCSA